MCFDANETIWIIMKAFFCKSFPTMLFCLYMRHMRSYNLHLYSVGWTRRYSTSSKRFFDSVSLRPAPCYLPHAPAHYFPQQSVFVLWPRAIVRPFGYRGRFYNSSRYSSNEMLGVSQALLLVAIALFFCFQNTDARLPSTSSVINLLGYGSAVQLLSSKG